MRIGAQLAEVPMIHERIGRDEALARARAIIEDVRLPDPDRILQAWPHPAFRAGSSSASSSPWR